jgi:hypothetical protein
MSRERKKDAAMNSTRTIRWPRAVSIAVIMALAMLGGIGGGLAATPEQAPPLAPGQSRVWFIRQLLPGTNYHAPMVYVNGTPIARSAQGTAFFRDFAPGPYAFSVENCLPQTGSGQNLTLQPGGQYAIEVQQDDNGAWDCTPPQVSYLRQVSGQQALYLLAQLNFLGAM